jgi:Lrp/AsnC family transcriptional regulator for asnA, asnC and gidA
MNTTVDATALAIIDLLARDGRMPAAEIARSLGGVSTKTITTRISRLTRERMVKIAVIPNHRALGYQIAAGIGVETEPGRVESVGQSVAEIEQVCYVALIAGDQDLWIQVQAAGMEDLHSVVADRIDVIPGVRRSELSFLVTRVLKDDVATPTWFRPPTSGRGARVSGQRAKAHPIIDETDRAIIDLLMDDGRMPSTEVARSLGTVSSKTVSRRLEQLVDEGIIRVVAVTDHRALGYTIIADIGIDTTPGSAEEVGQALAALQEVNYVALVTGNCDVWIQMRAADMEDLQRFILRKLHSVPGVERTSTAFLFTSALKDMDSWRIPASLP